MGRRGGNQPIPRPTDATEGDLSPWAVLDERARHVTLDDVRLALAGAEAPRPAPVEGPVVRASAVLAPLYEQDGDLHVILTRRAGHLRSHRGEVSFPGGGQEPSEDLLDTAFREANEEIGLLRDAAEVIGELDHLTTVVSRSYIVPYVAALPERPELRADPGEVERILHVSFDELLADGVFREERWHFGTGMRPIYFFEVDGDTVWGATAHMLRQLLATATGTWHADTDLRERGRQ